jgi:hypothetical protein
MLLFAEQTSMKRVFKTKEFARSAARAKIRDTDLCKAIGEVMQGKADDLGGGVFKKRLNKNMHRSIILAKGGRYWVYQYLFAKSDRPNIDDDELRAFRLLAKQYEKLTDATVLLLIQGKEFVEICHEN